MKKVGKPVFFIIAALIVLMGYLTVYGVTTTYGDLTRTVIKSINDVRWGIDIRGGVDVTFSPPEDILETVTDEQMAAAESIIQVRLVSQNITDSEIYTDYNNKRIIVRFPWKADETEFNPEEAIAELGATAALTFRANANRDADGNPAGETATDIILEGKDIVSAEAAYTETQSGAREFMVNLSLTEEGAKKFEAGTERLIGQTISIWMDYPMISSPTVQSKISGGEATISGSNFTAEEVNDLANKINAGALPFALRTENYNTISPTLGLGAKDAMMLAGVIAFLIIAAIMISFYRLPGFVAVIALLGQVLLMIASITGFFGVFPSFTLTLPGIAGIILSIGFGVDANIITAERIKEELRSGKTLDGALNAGFQRAFTAIFDGNVTVIIVAVILMAAFGPPDGLFSKALSWLFFMFGPSTSGSIYSFGYTLLMGVVLNLLMGVLASKLMLKSLSRFEALRKPSLYGGDKA